jgi:hypothetical protein
MYFHQIHRHAELSSAHGEHQDTICVRPYASEEALLTYAREELGCAGMTPVWLSCYVDGCRQELHADVPHGPWSFVLSLTNWEDRKYTGGETQLLKPAVGAAVVFRGVQGVFRGCLGGM